MLVSRAFFGLRSHARLLAILCGGLVIAWSAITVWPHIGLGQPATHPEVEMGGGSVRAIVDLASLVHQSDLVVVGRAAVPTSSRVPPAQAPTTAYPVDIERVVRGAAPAGQQVVVAVQVEDDATLNAGGRYVLFLKQASTGAYFIVGGAQGALAIDAADNVHPVNPGSPPTHAYDGQSLNAFIAAVTAVP